jgi:hypothetical protein
MIDMGNEHGGGAGLRLAAKIAREGWRLATVERPRKPCNTVGPVRLRCCPLTGYGLAGESL